MASSAEVEVRIGLTLDGLSADVAELPTLADTWDDMSENDRLAWDIEWSESMSRLKSLAASYRSGKMSTDQEKRFLLLLEMLRAEAPLLRQIDLEIPEFVVNGLAA